MDKKEALAKWTDACVVVEAGEIIVRDGNWTTIDRAMRHCADTSTVDEREDKMNGDTIVTVTPAKRETAPAGKTPINLPPFLLVVR